MRNRKQRRGHRDLDAWKLAMKLAKYIYGATRNFPDEERYGLVKQMRRAAVSIPSNIAEGAGRGSDAEFVRFLYMARGSLTELETQVDLSASFDFLPPEQERELNDLIRRAGETLSGLIGKINRDIDTQDS